jgi:hypothetical protein
MAYYGSSQFTPLLVGGYSLLPMKVQGWREKLIAAQSPTHGLGDAWEEFTPTGMQKVELAQDGGFYDAGTSSIHEALRATQATSRVLCYSVEGGTVGKRFAGHTGVYQMGYEIVASNGELTKANAIHTVSGQRDEGIILHALGARTTTGNSEGADSQDNGASSANGGVGFLQVTACSGITSCAITLRHSADDSTYANMTGGGFTSVTPANSPRAERIAVTGTVNRHIAVSWAITGAGSITFFVGFVRNA